MSPSPGYCPGNLVEVTGRCSLTLSLPSQQVHSTLGGGEEEEDSQVLAWDQASVCGESVKRDAGGRPCGRVESSWLWQALVFYDCVGSGLLVAVCGKRYRLLFMTSLPDIRSTDLVPLPKFSVPSTLVYQKHTDIS